MDRQQCVAVGTVKSQFVHVAKGVPQGLILGPVLFTLYIDDIVFSVTGCNIHLYADDTILHCNADIVHSYKSLQHCFSDLQVALNNHKLVLNADKTKFMLFTRAKNIDYDNLIISI